MKVFTLGNGFVADHLPYQKITEKIYDAKQIDNILDHYDPDVIVNATGFCGKPNVDQCELEKEKTSFTNTVLPIILANACVKRDIRLICVNSGCIFYGQSPNMFYGFDWNQVPIQADLGWKETDFPNPESYYSKSKAAADLILDGLPGVAVLRIRMPISEKDHSRNLINKLRGYSKIIDVPNSMTMMNDLIRCIDWFANNNLNGIYNVVNPEPTSARQIMEEYQKYTSHSFSVISEKELGEMTIAKRSNCILDGSKLRNAGFEMTPTKEALEKCMKTYIENINKGK